jgi:hypothetical protein
VDSEKEPFDDSKYQAGDKVPGIIVAPYTGDRGDISAKIVYKDGERISMVWRKLSTGSEFDVQFTDPKKRMRLAWRSSTTPRSAMRTLPECSS